MTFFYENIACGYYCSLFGDKNLHGLWNCIKFAAVFGRIGALFMHFTLITGNYILSVTQSHNEKIYPTITGLSATAEAKTAK